RQAGPRAAAGGSAPPARASPARSTSWPRLVDADHAEGTVGIEERSDQLAAIPAELPGALALRTHQLLARRLEVAGDVAHEFLLAVDELEGGDVEGLGAGRVALDAIDHAFVGAGGALGGDAQRTTAPFAHVL